MSLRFHFVAAAAVVLFAVGSAVGQSDFPDVLYLRFNEGEGISTYDAAIPGVASIPFVTPAASTWDSQNPRLGNSAFNLSADCLTSAPVTLPESYTVEFWIRADSVLTPGTIYPILWGGPNSLTISVNITGPTAIFGLDAISINSGFTFPQFQAAALGVLAPNVWSHFAMVVDRPNGGITTFVNGNLSTTATINYATATGPILATGSLGFEIGFAPGTPAPYAPFPGSIDELRVWGRALTPLEIQTNMNSELGGGRGRIRIDNGSTMTFNSTTQTFSIAGTVDGFLPLGFAAFPEILDPMDGATITINGVYTGQDTTLLSDVQLPFLNLEISDPGGSFDIDMVAITMQAPQPSAPFAFAGALGAVPVRQVVFETVGVPTVTLTGGNSAILQTLTTLANQGRPLRLVFALFGSGPKLREIHIDTSPTPEITPTRFVTDGQGAVQIGLLDMPPNVPVYNLFSINDPSPVGAGSFFGLTFSPFIFDQILLPFPTPPFKVTTTPAGTYFFGAPSGAVAPGLVVDHVALVVAPNGGSLAFVSNVTRIVF